MSKVKLNGLEELEMLKYEAEAEICKRNFINEIRYQEGYYDNDEEIRIW